MEMVFADFVDFACVLQPPNETVKVVRVGGVRHTHDSPPDETECVQTYSLAEGDRVEFEIQEPQRGRKGRQAINVSVLESSASFRGPEYSGESTQMQTGPLFCPRPHRLGSGS